MKVAQFITLIVLFCVAGTIKAAPRPVVLEYLDTKWMLISDPNAQDFQDFLKAIGVSDEHLDHVKNIQTYEIKKLGDDLYSYTVYAPHIIQQSEFKSGVERSDIFMDGRPYKSTVHMRENGGTEEMVFPNVTAHCTYNYDAQIFHARCRAKDNEFDRYFKRVPN